MSAMTKDVLVVEDDPDINRLVCAFLEQAGYTCRSASDGAKALQQVGQRIPGLVLLDVMLPDLDGFQICRKLKESQQTANVPVIMVTALGDDQNREKGLASGAAGYVPKPFDPDDLLATVAQYMPAGK